MLYFRLADFSGGGQEELNPFGVMQGRKTFEEEKELHFSLSAHVPEHNFYRQLKQRLDLDFLHELTQPLYGRCGQHSIDPVVFFKLCLVGYQLDEPLPWHSTLSRTRQLYPEALFESLFKKVFTLCVEKGMVSGSTQAIDSAPIKANASMESLVLKQAAASVENHLLTVSAENQGKKNKSSSWQSITAPDHQLRQLKRRSFSWQDALLPARSRCPHLG
jgi:transposase